MAKMTEPTHVDFKNAAKGLPASKRIVYTPEQLERIFDIEGLEENYLELDELTKVIEGEHEKCTVFMRPYFHEGMNTVFPIPDDKGFILNVLVEPHNEKEKPYIFGAFFQERTDDGKLAHNGCSYAPADKDDTENIHRYPKSNNKTIKSIVDFVSNYKPHIEKPSNGMPFKL